MTKEEIFEISDLNKEENQKYICHEAQEVAIYLQTDKFAPFYCLLEKAYICGRKTSEKQIDELVSKNDKLEKENAELKEQLKIAESNADSYYDKLAELKELKEKNKSYEGYVNDIPLATDPCKMCKVYKEHNGYDAGDRLVNNEWQTGICDNCCWFYDSKFEIGIDDNFCETCRHKAKMLTDKKPCKDCDNGCNWEK